MKRRSCLEITVYEECYMELLPVYEDVDLIPSIFLVAYVDKLGLVNLKSVIVAHSKENRRRQSAGLSLTFFKWQLYNFALLLYIRLLVLK